MIPFVSTLHCDVASGPHSPMTQLKAAKALVTDTECLKWSNHNCRCKRWTSNDRCVMSISGMWFLRCVFCVSIILKLSHFGCLCKSLMGETLIQIVLVVESRLSSQNCAQAHTHTHRHRGSLSRGKTFLSCSRGTACLLGKEKRHRSRSRRRRPDSLHSLTLCVCCSRVFLDIFSKVRFSSVSAWNQTSSICGPWCHSASLPTHSTVTMSLKAQKGGGAQHLLTCCTSNPEHRLLWTDRTWQDSM